MRRLALALGLIGFAGGAFAADYPLPPIAHEPIAYVPGFPAYFPWQGFYAGGQLTGANAMGDFTSSTMPLLALALRELALENEERVSSWQVLGKAEARAAGFGGFGGYNAQFENAIIGVEFNYTHASNLTVSAPVFPVGRQSPSLSNGTVDDVVLTGSGTLQIHDFGTLRARFGWVIDNFVPYATIGLAAARADLVASVTCQCVQVLPPPLIDFSFTQSMTRNDAFLFGFAGGFGVDVALTRNLFGRAEYEYVQFSPVASIASHIHTGRVGLGLKF
jgi:opacity protein-like surface antigen